MKLSIVDQSPVSAGMTPAQALQNSVALARLADRLGFTRHWVAEHHAVRQLASPAPEILLARIGAETAGIRIGSGGVLLPHYAPLKVAETFRMLHALYPGRIDLGIGRAPGASGLETVALRRDRDGPQRDQFPQQLMELLAFLHKGFPDEHPFGRIHVSPDMPGAPDVWLLGSSLWSASAAAQLGLPYAYAHFIAPVNTRAALDHYFAHFTPTNFGSAPRALLAMGAICAETQEEAEHIYLSYRLTHERLLRGDLRAIVSPDEARAELGDAPDALLNQGAEWPRYALGTPGAVAARIGEMAAAVHVDEAMIVTIAYDHGARMRSYELLARAFALPQRGD